MANTSRTKVPKDLENVRHKKFKLLPFYDELVKLFESGASLRQAADMCRGHGYFVDECDNTLISGLSRFRSDEITGWNKSPAQKRSRAKGNQDLIDPNDLKKVSTAEELDRLYKLQLGRVNMALQFERKMKVLNKNIVREIEAASSILQRKHEVEEGGAVSQSSIDLTVRPEIELKMGEGAKALENPESASRVLSVAKGLARLGLGMPTESGSIDVLEEADDVCDS